MQVSGFVLQIEAANNEGMRDKVKEKKVNICPICREINRDVPCEDCSKAIERGYQISGLAGRCRTGSDQTGTKWHARLLNDNIPSYKAMCGYAPKGRSGGWSSWRPKGREVSCPRCLKKLQTNCPKRAKG